MSDTILMILQTCATALGSIVILFAATKLLGNKQIAQLSLFDYINGITIGSIAADLAIAEERHDIAITVTAMIVYVVAGLLLALANMKSIVLRRFFSSETILLIENGKIYPKNLKKARLDVNDLLTKARNFGYFNISEIAYAIMENNGEISFLQKPEFRTPSLSDLNLPPPNEYLFANVILDGNIMTKNLQHIGKDINWLKSELKKQGYSGSSEIFLATVSTAGELTVFPRSEQKNNRNYFE